MNPTRLLLLIAFTALFGSCTKDNPTPENLVISSEESSFLLEKPSILQEEHLHLFENNLIPKSTIELIYPENSGREAIFNPPSVSQQCRSDIPSILIPQIFVNDRIEICYVGVLECPEDFKPKSIRWEDLNENKIILQLTDVLKLPYKEGNLNIKATVILEDNTELEYELCLNISDNIQLDNKGYIIYDPVIIPCISTTGESCDSEINPNARSIVVVDPVY